jgi:hypothetical protein
VYLRLSPSVFLASGAPAAFKHRGATRTRERCGEQFSFS